MTSLSLYLIRHGIAVERGTCENDAQRPLTEEGRHKTRQIAQRLHALGLRFDLLQTSPLTRAVQTAEIFQNVFGVPLETANYLAPGGDFRAWLEWFAVWSSSAGRTSLGLVGHEPDLSEWAERLVWGEVKEGLILKKGGILGLSVPSTHDMTGNACLFMLVPPKLLL